MGFAHVLTQIWKDLLVTGWIWQPFKTVISQRDLGRNHYKEASSASRGSEASSVWLVDLIVNLYSKSHLEWVVASFNLTLNIKALRCKAFALGGIQ